MSRRAQRSRRKLAEVDASRRVVDASTTDASDRLLAVGCHLWVFLGPLALLAVVLRMSGVDRRSDLLRRATAEVLDAQLLFLVPTAVGVVLVLAGQNLASWVVYSVWLGCLLYLAACGIVGAVRAWRGVPFRYPLRLPVVGP